ncbi:hypothetical protein COV19_07175 [Candidatus Woesearchaeota archaeon CG10_big_fil_rev_8_21_14_0_10_44_13]|nr:MAG: hypothetical protein COV19_07175 [Candidatus Woesearchaeota archaeon CG10_big_fil_rev_8_21_14_0_10_44_13]
MQMAKKKAEKEAKANRISKTTIILYAAVILISVIFLSVMSAGQSSGGGGGCCDCSECRCICCESCLNCDKGCRKDCGCMSEQYAGVVVVDPYTNAAMNGNDYYCKRGGPPPVPPEPQCDCYETQPCPLIEGVCKLAKDKCVYGTAGVAYTCEWEGCDAEVYGPLYQFDEDKCDGNDNDCDGDKDEGCDEDKDGFCNNDLECSSGKYNCGDSEPGVSVGTDECTDCDDSNPLVHPRASEVCDGIDNDCDYEVDEGCECSPLGAEKLCENQKGVCAGMKRICKSCTDIECDAGQHSKWIGCSYSSSKVEGYKKPEGDSWYCADNLDNDCDGKTDCEDSGCFPYCQTPIPTS